MLHLFSKRGGGEVEEEREKKNRNFGARLTLIPAEHAPLEQEVVQKLPSVIISSLAHKRKNSRRVIVAEFIPAVVGPLFFYFIFFLSVSFFSFSRYARGLRLFFFLDVAKNGVINWPKRRISYSFWGFKD